MAKTYDRREAGAILLGVAGVLALPSVAAAEARGRTTYLAARPEAVSIALEQTALVVIDMQNDFGSAGGMFDLAGVDISAIRAVVPNVRRSLDAARAAGLSVIYLKMAYSAELRDAGPADGPNRLKQGPLRLGAPTTAPDGTPGRILVRGDWGTRVIPELAPQPGELEIHKTRYSGFVGTMLDVELKRLGVRNLIVTGCTTSVCVESTVRDAMFLDYTCVLLEDCMAEPQGAANHAASLEILARLFAWVSDSHAFAGALV